MEMMRRHLSVRILFHHTDTSNRIEFIHQIYPCACSPPQASLLPAACLCDASPRQG